MNITHLCAAVVLTSLTVACSQAGEGGRRLPVQDPAAPESTGCSPRTASDCPPDNPSQGRGLKPAVPPVPESPIKTDCRRLPTQVERDTCTNRKESTG